MPKNLGYYVVYIALYAAKETPTLDFCKSPSLKEAHETFNSMETPSLCYPLAVVKAVYNIGEDDDSLLYFKLIHSTNINKYFRSTNGFKEVIVSLF